MTEIATPHQTRPMRVLITEPVTPTNRGHVARWLEDRGIEVFAVAVGALAFKVHDTRRYLDVKNGDRVVVVGPTVAVADHAHYKLWYEPIEEPTP